MSLMERRLQLLLDQDRFDRVSAQATRQGRSVASVIREAIDFAFPSLDDTRGAALQSLLEMSADPDPTELVESWAEAKNALAEDTDAKLSRVSR